MDQFYEFHLLPFSDYTFFLAMSDINMKSVLQPQTNVSARNQNVVSRKKQVKIVPPPGTYQNTGKTTPVTCKTF